MGTVSDTLTLQEQMYCEEIADRIDRLRAILAEKSLDRRAPPVVWYEFLTALKQIQGNASNDLSFIATLLAKHYLVQKHDVSFCAAEKPQGDPGIEIDCSTPTGQRVVGEIKTTAPYQISDFGAQQAVAFRRNIAKLTASSAMFKYFFVTEPAAFHALKKPKYAKLMPGIRIVLLTTGEEHDA